jgi:hypothetical protein
VSGYGIKGENLQGEGRKSFVYAGLTLLKVRVYRNRSKAADKY